MKVLKLAALFLLFSIGIASLLATTPSPIPFFEIKNQLFIKTQNSPTDPKIINVPQRDPESHIHKFACPNEEIEISWDIPQNTTAVLNASPQSMSKPQVKLKKVAGGSSLKTTILGKVSFSLVSDFTFIENLFMMPETICSGYPIVPIGRFVGKFEQKTPERKVFNTSARLTWGYYSNALKLVTTIPDSLGSSEEAKALRLKCNYQKETPNLVCMLDATGSNISQFTMILKITSSGLDGTYFGTKHKDWKELVSFSGTVKLSKEKQ